jgi:hypothetical protein
VSLLDRAPTASDTKLSKECSSNFDKISRKKGGIYTCKVQTESVAEKIAPKPKKRGVKVILRKV